MERLQSIHSWCTEHIIEARHSGMSLQHATMGSADFLLCWSTHAGIPALACVLQRSDQRAQGSSKDGGLHACSMPMYMLMTSSLSQSRPRKQRSSRRGISMLLGRWYATISSAAPGPSAFAACTRRTC